MAKRYRPTARRKMVWARSNDLLLGTPGTPLPAAGVAIDLLGQFRGDGGSSLGSTVTRVRIDMAIDFNWGAATTPPSALDQVAVGVLVDQQQSNQAEVPRPQSEDHADWMYWRRRGITPLDTAIPISTGAAFAYMTTWEIDVQSQRKIEELGVTLWLVVDPTFNQPALTIPRIDVNSSVLLKLP